MADTPIGLPVAYYREWEGAERETDERQGSPSAMMIAEIGTNTV